MIRFSFDPAADAESSFEHFSLEGDNDRGYVLLAWNEASKDDSDRILQAWFETLGEALNHCSAQYCIRREDWHAPTVAPPVGRFDKVSRGRRKGEATVLNAENISRREQAAAERKQNKPAD